MTISIAVFAHNEAHNIRKLINQLLEQTIFLTQHSVKIFILANGCTDNTAGLAKTCLTKQENWEVINITEPGKANAWNLFFHQYLNVASDISICMDADIILNDRTCIECLVETLKDNPDIWVALDNPVKDLEVKEEKTLFDKLSVAVSKSSNKGQLYICGQMYAIRTEIAKQIHIPIGHPVEDGYLSMAIASDLFKVENNEKNLARRVKREKYASHIFEAYTNPLSLIKHEIRVSTGVVINIALSKWWSNRMKDDESFSMNEMVQKFNLENKQWLDSFVQNVILESNQLQVVPRSLVFRRWRSLSAHSNKDKFLKFPIATLATIVDLIIFLGVNIQLRKNKVAGMW